MSLHLDLERRLDDELPHLADRAITAPVLALGDVLGRAAKRRHRRSALRTASAVLGVVSVAAGLAAVRSVADPVVPAGSTESTPLRSESPLTVLPDAFMISGVVRADAVAFQLADSQRLTFAIVGQAWFDGFAQSACVQYAAEAVCTVHPADVDLPLIPEPEIGGSDDLAFWTGVPSTAASVEFSNDGVIRWQHPVDGIAAFPTAVHADSDVFIALDDAGNEVGRAAWSDAAMTGSSQSSADNSGSTRHNYSSLPVDGPGPAADMSRLADLSQLEEDGYREAGTTAMRACLATSGSAAWTDCLISADSTVKTYLDGVQAAKTDGRRLTVS